MIAINLAPINFEPIQVLRSEQFPRISGAFIELFLNGIRLLTAESLALLRSVAACLNHSLLI